MASRPWEAKWRFEKHLGGGGQGKTSLVVSKEEPTRRGVLKTLNNVKSKRARGRMHREVVTLDILAKAGVKVPHVLDDHTAEFDDVNADLYFVMEYIPGKTLTEEITARGKLTLEQAAAVVLDLCKTVADAHENDVQHRDLKPDNIIVRNFDSPDVVIVDFGLSYTEEPSQDLTQVDEQFRNRFLSLPETNTPGGNHRDPRSDVTAICAVLYYCVTGFVPGHLRDGNGQPPHRRQGYTVRQVLQNDARCAQLEMLFDRAFAVEVDNRFQTCEEFLARLETVLKPSRLPEDPAAVAARLASRLRQQDRKTLLAEYSKAAQGLSQTMQNQISQLGQKIKPSFTPNIRAIPPQVLQSLPQYIDPLQGAGFLLSITLSPHNLSRDYFFVVGSKGNQCVLLRGTSVPDPGKNALPRRRGLKPGQWEELLWFDPAHLPTDEQLKTILDQSVNDMMEKLAGEILSKASTNGSI